MTHSDNESDLSNTPIIFITLFNLATRFTIFFKSSKPPAKTIRNINSCRLIILKILKIKRPTSLISRALKDYILLFTILTSPIDSLNNNSKTSSLSKK